MNQGFAFKVIAKAIVNQNSEHQSTVREELSKELVYILSRRIITSLKTSQSIEPHRPLMSFIPVVYSLATKAYVIEIRYI